MVNSTDPHNIYATFKAMADLRLNENSLHYGNFHWLLTSHQNILAYLREYEGDDR